MGQAQPEGGERAVAQAQPVAEGNRQAQRQEAGRSHPSLVDNMNAAKGQRLLERYRKIKEKG